MLFGEQSAAARTNTIATSDYVEVELRLLAPNAAGQTPVELRTFGVRQEFPPTSVALDMAALAPLEGNAHDYGELLGRQLFDNTELGQQFTVLDAVLDGQGAKRRVRLRLDSPALQLVRWERLCQPVNGAWLPMTSVGAAPFSRYVASDWKRSSPLTTRPVSALLVFASPPALDTVKLPPILPSERDSIRQAFTDGVPGLVTVRELASDAKALPTLPALRAALLDAPHIVHILCHGLSGPAGSALVMQDDAGMPVTVDATQFVDAMRGAATMPRLVVLSACESAATSVSKAFVSLAPALAAAGVDAVLAMSEPVSMDTARVFCTTFYQRLFVHGVIDRAVGEARAAVRDNLDWGVPVLFARQRDCQLLEFDAARVDTEYLDTSRRTIQAALAAKQFGERQQAAGDLMGATEALIRELKRSHDVVVGVVDQYRRTGEDPATFATTFMNYANDFQSYYDGKAWLDERSHCHQVQLFAVPALQLFRDALPPDDFTNLETDLKALGEYDGQIVRHLEEFLDTMADQVDAIRALVRANDVPGAITRKLAFEAQLNPVFRRSKALLNDIAARSHAVSKA